MEKLIEEIKIAVEKTLEARELYLKEPTTQNYNWWVMCGQYSKGLKKALSLIEGTKMIKIGDNEDDFSIERNDK